MRRLHLLGRKAKKKASLQLVAPVQRPDVAVAVELSHPIFPLVGLAARDSCGPAKKH
jgi:hypothetical protein